MIARHGYLYSPTAEAVFATSSTPRHRAEAEPQADDRDEPRSA